MYKCFDIFWFFVETCRTLCFQQTTNGHQGFLNFGTKLFSVISHVFHLHITLFNVSPRALLCSSLNSLVFFT